MDRKKIKIRTINVRLDPITYEKLLKCQGEWWTLTRTIEEAIHGFYYSKYKINNLPEENFPSKKVVNEKTEWDEREFEALKAQIRAKKAAKKEGAFND